MEREFSSGRKIAVVKESLLTSMPMNFWAGIFITSFGGYLRGVGGLPLPILQRYAGSKAQPTYSGLGRRGTYSLTGSKAQVL